MLNYYHSITLVNKSVHDLDQLLNIRKVKTCCGLIKDINGLAGSDLGKLGCKLDPLSLTTGELCAGLTEFHIAKSNIIESLDLALDGLYILKELKCLFYSHIKDIVDILALISDFQSLVVVSLTSADFTWYINVRKEVHLDLDDTVSSAGFTASALDVEGESSLLVTPCLGVGSSGKEVSYHVKYAGIGCRI